MTIIWAILLVPVAAIVYTILIMAVIAAQTERELYEEYEDRHK